MIISVPPPPSAFILRQIVPHLLLSFTLAWPSVTAAQTERNLLSGPWKEGTLGEIILPLQSWHPFPKISDREGWGTIPPAVRAEQIKAAEALLQCEWKTPTATLLLDYVRTGDRARYQKVSHGRREQLATLVLGECVEGKGRFLDDIANGIWTICEETYWGVPAHLSLQQKGNGLPDVTEPTVDLFAAETGTLLAWTSYLLGDRLDVVSPLLRERIVHEVRRRILTPNLERNDFWWMGFTREVNNWNPWICSNWLTAVLLLEENPGLRERSVAKILRCLDNFLNPYPDDGGCDEGPTYWGRAAGSLFDCLDLLASASAGRIAIYDHPLIRAMAAYIGKAHIHGEYFVNFADAAARHQADASRIFRCGETLHDTTLMRFGAYLGREQGLGKGAIGGQFGVLGRALPSLFSLARLLRTAPAEPLPRDVWLPGVQVMGARSQSGSYGGLFLAAQGGHNAESHNHNDVGNFIVYADGEPAIIDVGVESYTARTFSAERYAIWTMQSAFHNVPMIDGRMQREGKEFQARDVSYESSEGSATLSMDIAAAYPAEAGARKWVRTFGFTRNGPIRVTDEFECAAAPRKLEFTLMTPRKPEVTQGGRIVLRAAGEGGRNVTIAISGGPLETVVEPIDISDDQLRRSWGERIYRIRLALREPPASGRLEMTISQ